MANDIRPIIQNRINKLNMLIDAKTRDLQNAPRGSIYASMSHGKAQFCHIDSKKTYIRSSDESLIYLLSQKKYDENYGSYIEEYANNQMKDYLKD